MSTTRPVLFNLLTGTGGKLISTLVGVVSFSVVARHLGPAEFGSYQTIVAMLAVSGVAANLGTDVMTLRSLSEQDRNQGAILGSAVLLRGMASVLAISTGIGLFLLWSDDASLVEGAILGAIGWVAFQVNGVLLTVFQYRLRQSIAVFVDVCGAAVTLAFAFASARLGLGLMAMIGAMVAGHVVTLVLGLVFARREIPFTLGFDRALAADLIRHGWPIGLSIVVTVVTMRFDVLLLGYFFPPHDVGNYGVALKIFQIALVVPALLAGLMMKSAVDQKHGRESRDSLVSDAVSLLFMASVLLALLFWFYGAEFINLVAGHEYSDGSLQLPLLGIAAVFAYPLTFLRVIAAAFSKQRKMLMADGLGMIAALVAYLALIPQLGGPGAAAGKIIAFLVSLAVTLSLVVELPRRRFLASRLGLCTLAAAATGLSMYVGQRLGMFWMVTGVLGCFVYVAILYLGGAFRSLVAPGSGVAGAAGG